MLLLKKAIWMPVETKMELKPFVSGFKGRCIRIIWDGPTVKFTLSVDELFIQQEKFA